MAKKLTIYGLDGKAGAHAQLPVQFDEAVRTDLIKKAVLCIQSRARQPYGAHPMAGKRHSVDVSRRRRDYRGSYGLGISRVPRKVLSRRGMRMNWVGALAPQTVGGRRAHPPKAEKDWTRDINKKENRKAIRSAIAATVDKAIVTGRGHFAPEHYPFILANSVEAIAKTKELIATLEKLGFEKELARGADTTTRSGLGKMRGRTVKVRVSILLVTATTDAAVIKAAQNIPGMEAAAVHELNAEILAPGTHAGRITLFTEAALKIMEEKKLFL